MKGVQVQVNLNAIHQESRLQTHCFFCYDKRVVEELVLTTASALLLHAPIYCLRSLTSIVANIIFLALMFFFITGESEFKPEHVEEVGRELLRTRDDEREAGEQAFKHPARRDSDAEADRPARRR